MVGIRRRQSRCQFPDPEAVLRRNAECVSDAVEKCEHCGDVDSFRNLLFFPARARDQPVRSRFCFETLTANGLEGNSHKNVREPQVAIGTPLAAPGPAAFTAFDFTA